jgi:hypothetical protein
VSEAGDLLAAGSLILTVLAVLYSIWYPNVQAKLAIVLPPHGEDATQQLAEIKDVLVGQTIPLFLASLAATLIFLPKTVGVIKGAISDLADHGLSAISNYDPIQTTFVFVVAFTGFLAWQAFGLSRKLHAKRSETSPPPKGASRAGATSK